VNGIKSATAIVGLNPGAAPRSNPPIVPRINIIRFPKVKTFEKY
jgi:hypothetical protein